MVEKNKNYFKILTNNWSNEINESVNYFEKSIIKSNNKKTIRETQYPYPFLKWAGGKRQLISQIKIYFPKKFNKYIEPFVGGGAIFFELFRNKLINEKAILIDINEELINCYRVIRDKVNELIQALKKHKNEKSYYYKIRELDRNLEDYNNLSDIERTSRTIYLNKSCYNGLYRVNSKGQFNVPYGKYKNPNYCDENNLKAVSNSLKNIEIVNNSFEISLKYAEEDDFVYLDPPYYPLSATSSFTSYTKKIFGIEYQNKLFEVFKKLDDRGCKLILSNSYSDFIINLYKNFKLIVLEANRAINSDATKRGKIKEILILNKFE